MQKKMVDEGKKRIKILMDMGLWDEVMEFWEKGTACFSKPMEMLGQVTGVTFTFNEDEELKTIKEKLEEEKGFWVYYGIYDETVFGRMIFSCMAVCVFGLPELIICPGLKGAQRGHKL